MSDVKIIPLRRLDGIGRRAGLKIPWWQHRVGSTPTAGTNIVNIVIKQIYNYRRKY